MKRCFLFAGLMALICYVHAQNLPLQQAHWITTPVAADNGHAPVPYFTKAFASTKKIKSATLFITAHGIYEASINGARVGDAYLTPGWTSYKTRLQYQQYDITRMLQKGNNALQVMVARGWYSGPLKWDRVPNNYGDDISLLCQLEIVYSNGSKQTIATDSSWRTSLGNIVSSGIYDGETIDANLVNINGTPVVEKIAGRSFDKSNLVPTTAAPVRKHETFAPVKMMTTSKGEQVIDFGQNLVGWVVIKVKGNKGDTIKISHAEVLDKKGNFYTENLRTAKAQDIYILKGEGEETLEPHFTWHGFRFAKVEGFTASKENCQAVAIYSDLKKTGSFECSNPLINQLQHNIEWGMKGNFLDVPTDCPQRDERLGWTGDAQVFARTASYNRDVYAFFAKWMKDLAADQLPGGAVPHVIPNVLGPYGGACGWGDAATIIPWQLWLAYGNKQILVDQYPSMKAWVDFISSRARNNLWNSGYHFGDWLFYSENDDRGGRSAVTDRYLIAQCFYAYSTQLLINTANVLQNPDDAKKYSDLLTKIKAAFVKEYLTPGGALVSNTQTAYTLALQFDMLPEQYRQQAAQRLVANIADYDDHLTTGFLGTPYLCEVLTRFGYENIAYRLLLQQTYPSWLYPITRGATTVWERWDAIKEDSSFQTENMSSFNHYAYGAVGDWLYRTVAGIDTYEDGPGYLHSRIQPHPGGNLKYVNAELETPYGKISSHWRNTADSFYLDVTIPPHTKAEVYIPFGSTAGYDHVNVGGGTYHYATKKTKP